ncbi:MAG TPA: SBBP repeat-containing protein, partial [Terriglobales bacterium]|nr:SBBP repeat-containing protein [Terriglobales bacterium]
MSKIPSVYVGFISFFLFICTLPLSAQTDSSWTDIYDGPAHGEDVASSIALLDFYLFGYYIFTDACVTGWSAGIATGLDYATINYDPETGSPIWIRRYNGPGNGDDRAHAVVIDSLSDISVTGESWGDGTGFDYATIKYYGWGDTIWIRRYNGPGNGDDKAYAIAADTGGNVYVTGGSYGTSSYFDYATIKYKSDGDTAWVRRYSGLDQGNAAHAIAVDDSGNVYVTGQSRNGQISSSYATIKYKPDGEVAWTSRYRGWFFSSVGSDLALDNAGNLYVTGWSDGPSGVYDYVTLKYNVSDSNPFWGASFNSPYNMVDFAYGIAVDPPGNIYVTGESYKYEQIGSGYKYSSDCVTIKYTPGGDTLWLRRFNGWADSNDAGLDIAADTRGNVYVTGKSFGSNFDYATIKYSTSTGIKDEAELGNKPSRFML